MRLSVLDLVPVRTDQSTGDAVAASVELARAADRSGLTRYWVAEHHNMPAVAATSPPVLIALLGAATERIRIGSGGVMLPNHAPLAVAEQFALLEAAFPGRIDLGIGRAPGSDPVTSWALRGAAGRDDSDIENFPQYLDDVAALMSADGAQVQLPRQRYTLKATPAARTEPALWLLGSSMYSAHLAAAKGLPYVFAHHFSGQGTEDALATYRSEFRPSDLCAEPTTFLTVNVVVADTDEEAAALALPNLQNMARLRTGQGLTALDLVEDAEALDLPPQLNALVDSGLSRAVIGAPASAAREIADLAERFGVDEVMLHPVASARRGTDPARRPRECAPSSCWPKSSPPRSRREDGVSDTRPRSDIWAAGTTLMSDTGRMSDFPCHPRPGDRYNASSVASAARISAPRADARSPKSDSTTGVAAASARA